MKRPYLVGSVNLFVENVTLVKHYKSPESKVILNSKVIFTDTWWNIDCASGRASMLSSRPIGDSCSKSKSKWKVDFALFKF